MNTQLLPVIVAFTAGCGVACADGPILFPDDGGILNVRDYGAIPDDGMDDTAAIQKALDAYPNGNRIVYLPPGNYRISDTLKWPGTDHSNAQKRTILQGAGRDLVKLYLPESCEGFTDPESSRALIWTGKSPAQRFRNAVRDLTIEVKAGNPGAIALQFNTSNQGGIRQVTLLAAEDSGLIGLDMGFTDEIGPLLVKDLIVDGFAIGISTKWPVNSNTFEGVTLRNQREFGWRNYHQMVFVRNLRSKNSVPAILNQKNSWGTVTLIDSEIRGVNPGEKTPGILNERQMALRNVSVSGYAKSIDHADKGRDKGDLVEELKITNDTSHTNVSALFREMDEATFEAAGDVARLPVKETPVVPRGDLSKDWANILDFGAASDGKADSTAALQAAIDSGAKTVYLPAGINFRLEGEVNIRGPVERIIGLEGRFSAGETGTWNLVDGDHPEGLPDAPVVMIERLSGTSGARGVTVNHRSTRSLVVSSTIGVNIEGHGSGDIFIEDIAGQLNLNQPGQNAWCRQLNTEAKGTMLHNNGGNLWILGMKTEKIGTIIETVNGGHTELNGLFLYSNQGWDKEIPAFVIEDSTAVLVGLNERNFNRNPVTVWVRETHQGETRELTERPWVYLSR